MDTITHTALGACMGEAIAGKKIGKRAMLWSALVNNLPDIDMIAALWSDDIDILLRHRGITHSLLSAFCIPAILAWIFKKFDARMTFRQWYFLFLAGMLTHIFTDALTVYGTGLLEPFSSYRVNFNTLFIIDPLFMLAPLILCIALLVMKKSSRGRQKIAVVSLVIPGTYLLFTFANKLHVDRVAKINLLEKKIACVEYMTAPAPLSNFLWYIVAREKDGYHLGFYSILDKDREVTFEYYAKNDSLLARPCDQEKIQKLKKFSQNYYAARQDADTIYMSDVRFGTLGGWIRKQSPFVFSFQMPKKCDNGGGIHQSRFEKMPGNVFSLLWQRIKGNKTNVMSQNEKQGVE
jgi:inner membrane protein